MPSGFDYQKYVNDNALQRINLQGSTVDGKLIADLVDTNKIATTIGTVIGVGIGGFLGGIIGKWLTGWLRNLFNNQWNDSQIRQEIANANFPSYCGDLITFQTIQAAEKENRDGGNIIGHFKYWIVAYNAGFGSTTLIDTLAAGDLTDLNDSIVWFLNMANQCTNQNVRTVAGRTISGEKHRVFYEVVKAGALRAANMLCSRFSEVAGVDWGATLEIVPGTGGEPDVLKGGGTESKDEEIDIAGIKISKKAVTVIGAIMAFNAFRS